MIIQTSKQAVKYNQANKKADFTVGLATIIMVGFTNSTGNLLYYAIIIIIEISDHQFISLANHQIVSYVYDHMYTWILIFIITVTLYM